MLSLGLTEEDLHMTQGGIEFDCKPDQCMVMNLNLRSPSKILMRLSHFKADSFKKLENKLNKIDWTLFLPGNNSLKFNVTTKKSRLYHSNAIAQRCEKIIKDQFNSSQENISSKKSPSTQTIFLRVKQDKFTISLDSSGDLLFKRGIKKKVSKAPLRENLAFAMLYWAGFSKDNILIDPMCGSGTFSLEAAMIKNNLSSGIYRSFAFESWPGFSQKTWAYQKKQAKENLEPFQKKQIFASDIDDDAMVALEQNISNHDFCQCIDVSKKDFFSITPSKISPPKKGIIMLNPPYGKRLGKKDNAQSFFQEIGKKLSADFKGWRAGIILPSQECKSFLDQKLVLKPIFHGGLDLFAGMGKIK